VNILKRVEKELDERLRQVFAADRVAGEKRDFLEVYHAILEDAAAHVQRLPRGRRVFPYNEVTVELTEEHARLAPHDELLADMREAIAREECDPPEIRLTIVPADGFRVRYSESTAKPASKPSARLIVVHGKAERDEYSLERPRVNIGRLADVYDDQQRLTRRNEVFFPEGSDPANGTVSRAHAHIRFDSDTGEFRLFDDNSAYGTSVFRDGTLLKVPAGPGRGVVLRDADEIYFGQASVRFHR
jgi:hypothetical protein